MLSRSPQSSHIRFGCVLCTFPLWHALLQWHLMSQLLFWFYIGLLPDTSLLCFQSFLWWFVSISLMHAKSNLAFCNLNIHQLLLSFQSELLLIQQNPLAIVLLHIFCSRCCIDYSSLSHLIVLKILQVSRLFPLTFCS